jgi:hypothetical protein
MDSETRNRKVPMLQSLNLMFVETPMEVDLEMIDASQRLVRVVLECPPLLIGNQKPQTWNLPNRRSWQVTEHIRASVVMKRGAWLFCRSFRTGWALQGCLTTVAGRVLLFAIFSDRLQLPACSWVALCAQMGVEYLL